MKKALIFTAKIDYTGLPSNFKFGTYDNIIAADAGYDNALECGFIPDIIIGDFDSTNSKNTLSSNDLSSKVIVLPCEKDMTDAEAALDEAVNLGCDDILIIGGLNSRFDHTMGIICILAKYASSSIAKTSFV